MNALRTRLKVCGLRADDDLSFATHEVVSHVGVICVASSRRYVPPTEVVSIVHQIAQRANVMGVFADLPPVEVAKVVELTGIHGVQLHGRENAMDFQFLRQRGVTLWKAVSVSAEMTGPELVSTLLGYADLVDGVLLDTAPPKTAAMGVTGGHGQRFDWSVLPEVFRDVEARAGFLPIWVAGGLRPDNVTELLELVSPFGVDVSSGVEEAGRKSTRLIYDMIEAVEQSGT